MGPWENRDDLGWMKNCFGGLNDFGAGGLELWTRAGAAVSLENDQMLEWPDGARDDDDHDCGDKI
jgi:hypothetical protein